MCGWSVEGHVCVGGVLRDVCVGGVLRDMCVWVECKGHAKCDVLYSLNTFLSLIKTWQP